MTRRLLVLLALLLVPGIAAAQTTWSINPTTGTVILDNVTITDPLMELGVTVDLQLDKQATGGAAQCLQVGSTGLVTKTGSACGGTGSSPGGADTNVQYNSSGTFAGDASFTFASGSKKVTLFDLIISDQATGGAAQCLQIDTSGNVTKTGSACSTSAGTVTHTGGLTLHAPIIGNGTADIKATAVLTNGQMLIGSTGADPVPAAIGSSTLTITTGAGTLALDTASIATHQLVIGRGAGPYVGLGTLGTTTTVLHGNAAGDPTFGAVNASTDMTGILPVPNGGLGLASGTTGGIPYFTSATTMASSLALTNHAVVIGGGSAQPPHTLVTGTTGQFLQSQGSGSDPIWASAPAAGSASQGNAAYWTTPTTITGDVGIIYVAAYGTTRANIQSAINAAPAGGIIQFECGTTYTLDGTAISVTKLLTLQGCGYGGGPRGIDGNPTTVVLAGLGSQTVIAVDTVAGPTIQDLGITVGTNGTGISLTSSTASSGHLNSSTIIQRVWIKGGSYGIFAVSGAVRDTQILSSAFRDQTIAGTFFQGILNPFNLTNTCDGGGYILANNYYANGSTAADGALFTKSAAVTMYDNAFDGVFGTAVHFISPSTCVGPGPTQIQIFGNQIAASSLRGLWIEDHFGTGNYTITNNIIGCDGTTDDAFKISSDSGGLIFAVVFNSNTVALGGSAANHGAIGVNVTGGDMVQSIFANNTLPMGPSNTNYVVKMTGLTGYGVEVSGNVISNPRTNIPVYVGSGYILVSNDDGNNSGSMSLANLPAARNGSQVYCTDCNIANPCTSGGSGAFAKRINGAWVCN